MRFSWRNGLWLMALAGAFGGGYLAKLPQADLPEAAPPTQKSDGTTAETTIAANAPAPMPELIIPTTPPTPLVDVEVNKNDPTFKAIEKQLGINTGSLLDDVKAPPIILTAQTEGKSPFKLLPPEPPKLEPKPHLPPERKPELPPIDLPEIKPIFPPPANAAILIGPPQPTLHYLKTRDVQLPFETTKAGSSGIKFVEVWARDEYGRWVKLDRIERPQGSLRTSLPGEGRFGLSLVLESESGMRTAQPGEQTPSDVIVEIDLTPPTAQLLPIKPIIHQTGKVNIGWQMADKNLDLSTTHLEYSADGHTWHAIEGFEATKHALPLIAIEGNKIPPQRSFHWAVPQGLAHQVKLRVTVKDKAGNITTAETPEKVSVDLIIPAGRITNVAPQQVIPERGPMPRETRVPATTLFSFYRALMGS